MWSDNRGQEKVHRNSSLRPSLIKQSLLDSLYHTIVRRGPLSLFRQLHVVRFPCGREKSMGTYRYNYWEITKSIIHHSYEMPTYLTHIGFAR